MRRLIKLNLAIFCFLIFQISLANDGAYYASGNHLVPMYETGISCKKEILSIKRFEEDFVKVTVYYEFYNPGEAKTVEVGFEAASPSGDVDGTPVNGQHPYIKNFVVNMNDEILPFSVAIVSDSIYYRDGKFIEKKVTLGGNYVDFNYVYHFKANFKKGVNIISHTYIFDLSGRVDLIYTIDYILTAANRWSNRQIDDFTLLIDMGNYEDFNISKTFFQSPDEWKIAGTGTKLNSDLQRFYDSAQESVRFFIKEGYIFFQKMNFKPKGELFLYSVATLNYVEANQSFDYRKHFIPFQIGTGLAILKVKDEASLKILRNQAYAKRGFIFKSPEIQKYYESQDWYIPDPNYEADVNKISKEEQEWLKKIRIE